MQIIKYSRDLVILNLEQLPKGAGSRYLQCITSHKDGQFIAKQWRFKLPQEAEIVIDFGKKECRL
jgi:hypothetical protein